MSKLCVVIKVYNEFEMLEECIKSLENQTTPPDQVIVSDDGSPNPKVSEEILRLSKVNPNLKIKLIRLPLKDKPDLDTVGRTFNEAWFSVKEQDFDYFATLDADTVLPRDYYKSLVEEMEKNPNFGCTSGVIRVKTDSSDYIEDINIGSKIGRKDARGSGKIIRVSLLQQIQKEVFPKIDWDTWINTKAKVLGMKCPQIDSIHMFQGRPTTRVAGKDNFRSGRLTYHFGYNPILLFLKIILAKRKGLVLLRGYLNARKADWRLEDAEVRKYFGWKFFLHL